MTTRKKLAIAAAVILIALGAAYGYLFWPQSLPGEIETALAWGTDLKLLSIDPSYFDKDGNEILLKPGEPHVLNFHVLEETPITAESERRKIIDEFKAIVADQNSSDAACFGPRHDIQFTFRGKVYDLLICYHCMKLAVIVDGVQGEYIRFNKRSPATFNAILNAANVPLPKQENE